VVPIAPDFLGLLYEAAALVGAVCASLAATRMTLSERSELKQIFLDCEEVCKVSDSEAFAKHHRLFHNAIRDGAHNPPLGEALQQSRRRIAPFTKATFTIPANIQATLDDQNEILEAIIDQDGDRAGSLMKHHINRVGMQVVNNFKLPRKGHGMP
jgi:DNA-binding GntR family transcriptional regulator